MQRGVAGVGRGVQISPGIEQHPRRLHVAAFARNMQRGVAVAGSSSLQDMREFAAELQTRAPPRDATFRLA